MQWSIATMDLEMPYCCAITIRIEQSEYNIIPLNKHATLHDKQHYFHRIVDEARA